MKKLTGNIEVTEITTIMGEPDEDCKMCGGTGEIDGLVCLCTVKGFNKPVKSIKRVTFVIPD